MTDRACVPILLVYMMYVLTLVGSHSFVAFARCIEHYSGIAVALVYLVCTTLLIYIYIDATVISVAVTVILLFYFLSFYVTGCYPCYLLYAWVDVCYVHLLCGLYTYV